MFFYFPCITNFIVAFSFSQRSTEMLIRLLLTGSAKATIVRIRKFAITRVRSGNRDDVG